MKKYTAKDFETFEREEQGWLICPSGDYTEIRTFPEKCSFGAFSRFGEMCNFGKWHIFGEACCFGDGCTFGELSTFGAWNRFEESCVFGYRCEFGGRCRFDKNCNFGERCNFNNYNSFGENCNFCEKCSFGEWSAFEKGCKFGKQGSFGEYCCFGYNCSHEGLTNSIYMAVDRIGSELRKTYFFKAEEGYFVRAGCFFGTLKEFKKQLRKTHKNTIHETTYLMACKLAVKLLNARWKK